MLELAFSLGADGLRDNGLLAELVCNMLLSTVRHRVGV